MEDNKGVVINYGEGRGATKREFGASEVLPLQKGGGGKSFSHPEGGHRQFWGIFNMGACKF